MNIDPNALLDQPPFPTRTLWRAMLTIYNYFLVERLAALQHCPESQRPPTEVVDAMRLFDCWLDAAIENDWLEIEEEEH